VRVLLANEPRAYREVIAETFRELRPNAEILIAEPAEIDDAVRRSNPDVVICSEVTDTVRDSVPIWVELYPGYEARSVVSVGGMQEEFAEITLDDLLSVVDRAEGLV
jgi:hypothetical protein